MPSLTGAGAAPLDDNLHYSVEDCSEAGSAEKTGGAGEKVFTLGRKTADGETRVVARLVFNHSLEEPSRQTLREMMIQLSAMTSTLQGETVQITSSMLQHNKTMIKAKAAERTEQFENAIKLQEKLAKKQKNAEVWGWVGTVASVLVTGASMGALGPVAATCMIASTAVGVGNQILGATGALNGLQKSNPEAAKAVNYSLFALQIALSVVSLGAAAYGSASSAASNASSNAARTANTGVKAGDMAEVAAKTGGAMARSSSSQGMADDLVQGVSDMARSAGKSQQAIGDAGDAAAKSAANASQGGVDAANNAGAKAAQGFSKLDKASANMSRVGHAIEGSAAVNKMGYDIQVAVLGGTVATNQANLVNIKAFIDAQQSFLSEIASSLQEMIENMEKSSLAAMDAGEKLNASRMTITTRIGPNPSRSI
jgi:hypothetical protein